MTMRRAEYLTWYLILFAALWAATNGIEARFGPQAGHWAAIVAVATAYRAVWMRKHRRLAWRCGWAARGTMKAFIVLVTRFGWRRILKVRDQAIDADGLQVWVGADLTADEDALLPRLADALRILGEIQPSRRQRIDWLGVRLAVVSFSYSGGAYLEGANVIVITTLALRQAPAVLASLLVHELNHARVARHGLIHPFNERRIERLARLDQYHFAVRVYRTDRVAATRIREIVLAPYRVGFVAKGAQWREHHRQGGIGEPAGQGG